MAQDQHSGSSSSKVPPEGASAKSTSEPPKSIPPKSLPPKSLPPKSLPPAAERALAEAEGRRRVHDAGTTARPAETGGRGGLDPVRYEDWEIKGRAIDF